MSNQESTLSMLLHSKNTMLLQQYQKLTTTEKRRLIASIKSLEDHSHQNYVLPNGLSLGQFCIFHLVQLKNT